jgi:exodeoxyribonuclease VII large subunit
MTSGGRVDLFTGKRILTVTQFTNLVSGILEENFDHVWVEGEVSNLSTPTSGHIYFTLKDANAQVRAVIFRASARILKFKIADGMQLIARGRVSVFAPRGEYQLITEYVEPKGIGALQLAFLQLKERLHKEGLFSESRKKPIPRLPQRVGIVTSPTGAAIHDILHVLDRRFSNIHLLLSPVRVQGEGAAAEIASAIRDFNKYGKVDVIIVGRGGGSIEDLWAFNEEVVARAIAESKIPIISAVGHEVDITISDLAADLRAPTPSAAAELVIATKAELSEKLTTQLFRLNRVINLILRESRGEVLALCKGLRDPSSLIDTLSQRYDYLLERLNTSITKQTDLREQKLELLLGRFSAVNPQKLVLTNVELVQSLYLRQGRAATNLMERFKKAVMLKSTALDNLSPLATLARGYSTVFRISDGQLIRDSSQITSGDHIGVQFAHGKAQCIVEQTTLD